MIKLIAAVAQGGVIGNAGKMPWRLPEDLKRFKALTMGHVLVMGRKTYESIGRPLPGRQTIVLSHRKSITEWVPNSYPPGLMSVTTMRSMQEVIAADRAAPEPKQDVFICGGAEVYRAALEVDIVDEMLITHVHHAYDGDVFFPLSFETPMDGWEITEEVVSVSGVGPVVYDFTTYQRKR